MCAKVGKGPGEIRKGVETDGEARGGDAEQNRGAVSAFSAS